MQGDLHTLDAVLNIGAGFMAWRILPPWPVSTSQNSTELGSLTVVMYCRSNRPFR